MPDDGGHLLMKRDERENTERIGVYAVGLEIETKLGWIFREQPISDYGIDAHIEIVDERREPTGGLIGLQIKSGKSYFDEPTADGYIFRGETKHLDYWMGHSLPILVVLHNPTTEATHWQVVNLENVERTEKGWKLTVPTSQVFDELSCLSWKWRRRSSVKITERTYEEGTEAFHSRRKSSHLEAASCGQSTRLGAV
jgi:hypothetical protein